MALFVLLEDLVPPAPQPPTLGVTRWRWHVAPWVALAAALALTVGAASVVWAGTESREEARFERAALETRARIQQRLDTCVTLLRGAAGFLAGSPAVNREAFRRYIAPLDLQRQYPGLRAIGFSQHVTRESLAAFEAVEREASPGFRVWPEGNRPEYDPIVLLEPFDVRNRTAVGFDMFTEPNRRVAMDVARDTGLPAVSRKIILVRQIDGLSRPGFQLYLPIYATPDTPGRLEERRRLLRGFAFAPSYSDEFFAGALGPAPSPLPFQVYDAVGTPLLAADPPKGGRQISLPLAVAGSAWQIRFVGEAGHGLRGASIPLVFGLCASVLLFLLMRARGASRARSEDVAARLRASERRYRQLFEDSPLPTWVYDRTSLRFLDVNEAAVRHYGWSREQFLAMTLCDIRPLEDVPAMLADLANGGPKEGLRTPRHRRRDGSTIIVEISAHEFLLEGRPARLVVAHDVTERERLAAAQRKVEARFARLSDSGIIGVTVARSSGSFVEANDAFLRMIGYSREDLEAGRLGWEMLTAPDWRAVNVDIGQQLAERGFAGPTEKEYVRKDGSTVQALVGMAFIEGGFVIAFVLDISERKRLEQLERAARALEDQNHRIRESDRLKSEFLANMSHELRTPLNAILGFTEMLHDGEVGQLSAAQKECLGDVLSSGRHLLQLINDILDLAKVEAGKLEFHPRQVLLDGLVADVVSTLGAPLAEKNLQVRQEVQAGLDPIIADEMRLKQVLYNYLSNAIKFSTPGAEIAVRALSVGARDFRLEVEDHGVGIRAEDLEKLFVTFQQLDSGTAKRHAGTGLGLALTRRLVEAQGGTVGVRSVFGSGSVFHAVLPRGKPVEATWQARPS